MCLQPVGGGLSVESARELGLQPGIPVGTSLIDAHAGSMYENVCWQIFVCNTSKCIQHPDMKSIVNLLNKLWLQFELSDFKVVIRGNYM